MRNDKGKCERERGTKAMMSKGSIGANEKNQHEDKGESAMRTNNMYVQQTSMMSKKTATCRKSIKNDGEEAIWIIV